MDIFVTVGMSSWPFDRLIAALEPLCREHRVFAQIGTSRVTPPCPHARFIPYAEAIERLHAADVVITHAGNTVRLVQRTGKVPIAVARSAEEGEMANDHQVEYLRHEEQAGRVVAVWDVERLPEVVAAHADTQAKLLAARALAEPADAASVAAMLDELWDRLARNPFRPHPLRRYAYAWEELSGLTGRHLDVGCGTGEFLGALAATTRLCCYGVDPHEGYLCELRGRYPELEVSPISIHGPLPYPDGYFNSVSLLDVLEHCPSEDRMLGEIRRVLQPDGYLVLTVPGRHAFSFLDPDNFKFRFPGLHRALYSLRFGRDIYRERFVDHANQLHGDMSLGKREHTNYRRAWLIERLRAHGFEVTRESGANLFWRWFQIPALLAGPRLRRPFDWAIRVDGELFDRANIFLTVRRVT